MLVLGIETSCDETGLALVEDGRKILGAQLASSLLEHQRYGGVVPEIASRAHVELLTCELESLLVSTGIVPAQIDRIAVTFGPGLPGCLLAGVAAAKALALAWRKELVPVNHLQAHLFAAGMEQPDFSPDERAIGLVISGGHTGLIRMNGIRRLTLLGQTRDDAVGEAFDKVAKLLSLGFPGGPEIQRVSNEGNPKAFRFSVPRIRGGSPYDFSLSGIKTAVLYKVQEETHRRQKTEHREQKIPLVSHFYPLSSEFTADMAASFQSAIVEEIVQKAVRACEEERIDRLLVGGGVVANRLLRERLTESCGERNIRLALPSLKLCTDNGMMVAGLGAHLESIQAGELVAVPDLRWEVSV